MASVEDLIRTLRSACTFEAAEKSASEKRIRLLGRLHLPKNAANDWLVFLHHLHKTSARLRWNVDTSKLYFNKDGKLVFGWRLIFQSDEPIAGQLQGICNVISTAPKSSRRELTEVSLHAGQYRNHYKKGKGAQLMGKAKLGPYATTEEDS